MTGQAGLDSVIWRPQNRFAASIVSLRELRMFNDTGGVAVNFDVRRAREPEIALVGTQSESLSLWETRSGSGFVTRPKFNAELVTIRFVTSGTIVYRHRVGDIVGSPTHATLVGFEDLREVEASDAFGAVSATLRVADLATAHAALTGGDPLALPRLASVAEIASPGMRALFCTLREVRRQVQEAPRSGDLLVPLVREIMAYQLLSVWPRQATPASATVGREGPPRSLQTALDYIMANLRGPLMLADIAAAAGISVRSLQDRFRRDLGQTPVQFLIDQRLERAHRDLLSPGNTLSVAAIGRRWGFAHPSDFGQRYRKRYGCTPSATRHQAGRAH